MSTNTSARTPGKSRSSTPRKPPVTKKKADSRKELRVKKKGRGTAGRESRVISTVMRPMGGAVPERFLRVLNKGSFSSVELGTKTGKVIDTVLEQGVISITKHGNVKFVMLTLNSYNDLLGVEPAPVLGDLEKQFNQLYADMQKPGANDVFTKLLDATPEQLTRAARKSVAERG